MTAQSDRPWMTALEMQFAAAGAMRSILAQQPRPNQEVASAGRSTITRLGLADTYAWSRETITAVWLASRTIPLSTRLDSTDLPSSSAWWWFDTPPGAGDMVAMSWFDMSDCIDVLAFVLDGSTPRVWAHFFWKRDRSVSEFLADAQRDRPDLEWDDVQRTLVLDTARILLAGVTWLQQRILSTSSGHVERHRRKQLTREHDVTVASDVKVVQLRRVESQSRLPSAGGSDPVDWSCRWIVGGHWRNQPYKEERKLIYILPYVKGPDDKPLKVPTHTVYQVSR